jgi:hypothetical protein
VPPADLILANHNIMGASIQTITAKLLKILELLLHAPGTFSVILSSIGEELAYHWRPRVLFLVQIHFGRFHSEDAKIDRMPSYSNLRQNTSRQIVPEWVVTGKMTSLSVVIRSGSTP